MDKDSKSSAGGGIDWAAIEARPGFRSLIARKAKFIITATVFFMTFYLALPVLVGYWPDLMKKEVMGKVNVAYVFALSQFIMAWVIAFIYVRVAAKWDREAADVIKDHH
jgi:uncharacterized membrane protein (DUF485 family)